MINNTAVSSSDSTSELSPKEIRKYRMYLLFWAGQLVSILGSSIIQFSIIWWITVTTQSAWYLAVASLLGIGSGILVQPFAGVIADRYNRKFVIGMADFMQALVTMGLMALFFMDIAGINHVLALLTLRAVLQGFHTPAVNAIIPTMVPRSRLSNMNSLRFLFNGIINFIGPLLGATLIALIGIDNLQYFLIIDALTFLISLFPLLIISIPKIPKKPGKESSFREDFSGGFKYIVATPGLLPLLLTYAMVNFFLTPTFTILPLMVSSPSIFAGNEVTLATALAFFQAGAIIISSVFSKKSLPFGLITGVSLGIVGILSAVIIIGFSGILHSIPGLILGMVVMGVCLPVANISSMTIWQKFVPHELQGRVMSVRITISQIITPVSIFLIGILAEVIAPQVLIFAAGIIGLTLFLLSYSFSSIRYIESNYEKHTQVLVNQDRTQAIAAD